MMQQESVIRQYTTLESILYSATFFTRPKTLAGHVDDNVANPIGPSSSALDPWCAVELLFRAACHRKQCVNVGYCRTSNRL